MYNNTEDADGLEGIQGYHMRKNSSQKYIRMLEEIEESQNEKTNYYKGLVDSKDDSIDKKHEQVFVITPNEDFSQKQTPELGQKDETPLYLQKKFQLMKAQGESANLQTLDPETGLSVPNHMDESSDSDFNRNLQSKNMEDLFSYIGKQNPESAGVAYKTSKCQKILFDDTGDSLAMK